MPHPVITCKRVTMAGTLWHICRGKVNRLRVGGCMDNRMRGQDARRPDSWRRLFRFLALGHTVADARFGEDVLGIGGVVAEVAAKAFDGGAKRSEVAAIAKAPDTLEEMVVGQGSAGVGGEFSEQAELHGGEAEGAAGNGHGACSVVDGQVAAAIGNLRAGRSHVCAGRP